MSTFQGCASQFFGDGIMPVNALDVVGGTHQAMVDAYRSATLDPVGTGHFNTSDAGMRTGIGECPEFGQATIADFGDLYDPANYLAYAWTANASDVFFSAGNTNLGGATENMRQVNLVYSLAMAEDTWGDMEANQRNLKIFAPFHLTKEYLERQQDGTMDCSDVLGEECAQALLQAVYTDPHTVPTVPSECKGRFSESDEFEDAMILTLSRQFPKTTSDLSTTPGGFVDNSSGFTADTDGTDFHSVDSASMNLGVRINHSALFFEGLEHYGDTEANARLRTRSAIFSRGFPFRTDEATHEQDMQAALRAVQPLIVSVVHDDNREASAVRTSMMCVQANVHPNNVLQKGDGYSSGGSAGKRVTAMVLGAALLMGLMAGL